ncbi:hypothetical protein KIH86_19950 [Paenibacillus sp. HN-1]|uniref:beta-ketoacyl synthase N-terminal-like domain-containing protein n=1 Tax=Paenibacillus TaxID=44249 RepID=UPI001CA81A34|nr:MULTISPECIES: beta-ketoacyl synthase N-terminal-like domain-containing protein [Paenibacillus]MBY9081331.1 hypothetical protein [Paenibacillus sp. CGMCC 1.18879]MBY9086484.1 hypothetical protein [Paenibacillus sinensis]
MGTESKNTLRKTPDKNGVAIIGVSLRFPKSDSLDEFWEHLVSERCLITEIPSNRWEKGKYFGDPRSESNKTSSVWGGFIDDADCFDASFFNISPREAMFMDPQQRMALELAWKAIEDAGYKADSLKGSKTGVFMGVCNTDYTELIEKYAQEVDAYIPTGTSNAIISNRISYWFDFTGPSLTLDTACASSLVSIHQAVRSLENNECDYAMAGGVNICWSPRRFIALSQGGMLSKEGRCRAFDEQADGYVRAEGGAIIMLKPYEKAVEDQDHIYAVIKGVGTNHGGRTNSLTITNPKAHAELITEVYKKSGISPETVSYIETHGPGTPLGDPIEVHGLKMAFNQLYNDSHKKIRKSTCGLGSVKTNIGHLESAAGIAGVIKVIASMKNRTLPACVQFEQLNSVIKLSESPFYIVNKTKSWEIKNNKNSSSPRRAGVSSFGFGGSNAHIILEEYIPNPILEPRQVEIDGADGKLLIPLSAKNSERLTEYVRILLEYIKGYVLEKEDLLNGETPSEAPQQKETLELKIRSVLSTILQVNGEDVEIEKEFRDFGVEPVNQNELVAKLQEMYGVEIEEQEALKLNSIASVADCLRKHGIESVDEAPSSFLDEKRKLRNLAYTLRVGREAMDERVIFLAGDTRELVAQMEAYLQGAKMVSNCWKGNIKQGTEIVNFMAEDEDLQELVHKWVARGKNEKIAELWVKGFNIDWEMLYGRSGVRRISLPTYPFARERYWIPETKHRTSQAAVSLDAAPAHHAALSQPISDRDNPAAEPILQTRRPITLSPVSMELPLQSAENELKSTNVKSTNAEQKGISLEALQQELAMTLAEVLYVEPSDIDIDKKFIEIGLDSIIAVEWIRAVNKQYGTSITATLVYDYPTIREFVSFLEQELNGQEIETAAEPVLQTRQLITLSPSNLVFSQSESDYEFKTTNTEQKGISFEALQQELAISLAEVIYVKQSDIDPDKKFIEIGLDSIIAVEWIRIINKQYGTSVTATMVYDYPTIREFTCFLADEINESGKEGHNTLSNPVSKGFLDEVLEQVYQGTIDIEKAEQALHQFNVIPTVR